ncbi:MAG TPA: EutN/CcmL family microcompartment protein [Planctomycetota bacterium]|jgi:ethanolamine utilization protein EutN|nr:EutN/CcmL family microcompartment protein [Planctomycetota bacterium]
MILCRVQGSVTSTQKNEHLTKNKLLICQPVALDGVTPEGASFLALDVAQAGPEDLVLVNKEGSGARLIFDDEKIPVQTVVVAVVDDLDLADEKKLEGTSVAEATRGS